MMKILIAVGIVLSVGHQASAQATRQAQPPANALSLSEVIAALEAREDVAYFDEIEWDSDGYWEVEFYRPDGVQIQMDIDPVSGQVR